MPVFHARGISAHLSTLELASTVTNHIKLQKNEAAKNSEVVEKRLRKEGAKLKEHTVGSPGDLGYGLDGEERRPFRVGFLDNAPFLMARVQAGDEMDLSSRRCSNNPTVLSSSSTSTQTSKALALHVKLSEQTFSPLVDDEKAPHLMIDVFLNGVLASSVLVHQRDINNGAKSYEQIFAGHRCDHLAERPWIIISPSEHVQANTQLSHAVQERWQQISDILLGEADARGFDSLGKRPPSAAYLENLATMQMPDCLNTIQKFGGSLFGVVDFVVTAGYGNKTTVRYLKSPTRLVDGRYCRKKEDIVSEHNDKAPKSVFSSMDAEGETDPDHNWYRPHGLPRSSSRRQVHSGGFLTPQGMVPPIYSMESPSSPAFVNPMDLDIVPQWDRPGRAYRPDRQNEAYSTVIPDNTATSHRDRPSFTMPNFQAGADQTFTRLPSPHRRLASSMPSSFRDRWSAQLGPAATIGFPLLGPIPPPQGPPPAVGMFSTATPPRPPPAVGVFSTAKSSQPSSSVRPNLIDPNLPRYSLPVSRFAVTMNGAPVLDHVWSVPKRIMLMNNNQNSRYQIPSMPRLANTNGREVSPGSVDRTESPTGYRRRGSKGSSVRFALATSPPTSPEFARAGAEVVVDKQRRDTIHDGAVDASLQNQSIEHGVASKVSDERSLPLFKGQDVAMIDASAAASGGIATERPSDTSRQSGSALAIPVVHSPKPIPPIVEGHQKLPQPEKEHDHSLRSRGPASSSAVPSAPPPTTPLPRPSSTTKPPITLSSTNSPLSSAPSSPTPSPPTQTPHPPPPRRRTPSSANHPRAPPRPRPRAPYARQPSTAVNPPVNRDSVVRLAEGRTEAGTEMLRQVRGEKSGCFREDMVVVGMRFFVGG